jgi:alpha-L-fucosidase 2
VGAWLGQHFYLHWRYTMDRDFLAGKAYPWLKDVATYLDEVSIRRKDGKRKLPISSSPEIHDNRKDAWFGETTNFDLSLIRFTYRKAAELAKELGKDKEAEKWEKILSEWTDLSVDEETGLMIAPGLKFTVSHRHFSHAMAVYPLRLLTYDHDQSDRDIMTKTVNNLLKIGSDYWTGYSFSWLGNMQAQIRDGEGAAKTLRIFAENFCLPNSFHVNGEQHNRGYSKFKYRPFTLEGNFAFASGIQEMLIQSNTGIVALFPAIPAGWNDVSFDKLRTEGAFLVSAEKKNGRVTKVTVTSEKGGTVKIKNPFDNNGFKTDAKNIEEGEIITIKMKPGETVVMTSK